MAILHVNCPSCAGTLGLKGTERVVRCEFCGSGVLAEIDGVLPGYQVLPELDDAAARRAVQDFLKDPELPRGLLKQTRFHSAVLNFVPYYEVTARRMGRMKLKQDVREGSAAVHSMLALGCSAGADISLMERTTRKVDTRIVMGDLHKIGPAIDLSDWGLDVAAVNEARTDPRGLVQPLDRAALEALGTVFDVSVPPEALLREMTLTSAGSMIDDQTEVIEPRTRCIWYPVWRVRYRYQGRLFSVVVDARTGRLLAARAPQDDHDRVLWLIGTAAFVCFLPIKIFKGYAVMALSDKALASYALDLLASNALVSLLALLAAVVMVLLALGLGWEQFRYPGEVLIRGELRTVRKVRPATRTRMDDLAEWTEKLTFGLFSAADQAYKQAVQNQAGRWR